MEPQPEAGESGPPPEAALQPYAVVFSGGGALGAWEVGCIQALATHFKGLPRVRAGASAGALNAAALAAGFTIEGLSDLWRSLTPAAVFNQRPPERGWPSLLGSVWWQTLKKPLSAGTVMGWVAGAATVASGLPSIFDSSPLEKTLRKQLEPRWEAFRSSIASTVLAVTDTLERRPHYFLHSIGDAPASAPGTARWEKLETFPMLLDALMATSAIPLLFPPRGHYVDGGVVRNQPLSAAARLVGEGEPIFILLPHTDRLPSHPNLGNLVPTLLDIWLGAGLESEMRLIGIANTAREGRAASVTPVCLIKAGKDLEEVSGLLRFGAGVEQLLELGRADATAALSRFDPGNPATWPPEARP